MKKSEYAERAMELAELAAAELKGRYPGGTETYASLAEAIAETGEFRKAYQLLKSGAAPGFPYHNSIAFNQYLVSLAGRLAAAGQMKTARRAARQVGPKWARVKALLAVALASNDKDDMQEIRELAGEIRYAGDRTHAFCDLATVSRHIADFKAALAAAGDSTSSAVRSVNYSRVVTAYLEINDLENAAKTVRRIEKADVRAVYEKLVSLFRQAASGGGDSLVRDICGIDDTDLRDWVLEKFLEKLLAKKDYDTAWRLVQEAEESETSILTEITSLGLIQRLLEKQEFETVRRFAGQIAEPVTKVRALTLLASATGQEEDLRQAKQAVDSLDRPVSSLTVDELAAQLAKAGRLKDAHELLDKLEDESGRAYILSSIAAGLADKGDLNGARKLAATITKPLSSAYVHGKVAALSGQEEDFELAFEAASRIEEPRWRASQFAEFYKMWRE